MATKSFAKLRGLVFYENLGAICRPRLLNTVAFRNTHISYNGTKLHTFCRRTLQLQALRFSTSTANFGTGDVVVKYENGLPQFYVPLPSRQELCQFTLRPISNTLGDFIQCLKDEDHGIDRASAYNTEGTRIAKSTPIDILLQNDFQLVINDKSYQVTPPKIDCGPQEQLNDIANVKNTIAQLFSTLNIEQYQLQKEKEIMGRLEELKVEMQPYDAVKQELEEKASKRMNVLSWGGLGMMGLQFGILARLTWWEYSWDIMEPVTYFVTYGTSMGMFAYYVLTKQEYNFSDVNNREHLLTLHRNAKKSNLSIDHYNKLCDAIQQAELDLKRLRDPLQLQLPIQQVMTQSKNQLD